MAPLRSPSRVRPAAAAHRSYRGSMARANGSNMALSWIAGVICIAVVAALLWLAVPMGPVMVQFVGDTLRSVAPGTAETP